MDGRPGNTGGSVDQRWPRYEAAATGFRHYWYPVLESRKLRKRPKAIKVLDEKIVLVRDGGKVHALTDRCAHRGVPLSIARCEFPGTLTCPYHGWTYDLATGDLVAALTDGPDSPIVGASSVRIPTYPVEERAGLIWVYVGDPPHPPVEVDIPEPLLRPDAVVEPMVEPRLGNWRYAMENAVDESHAKSLHRNTPFYFFTRFPGYQTDTRMVPSEDGVWLRRHSTPVFEPAEYPRLGKWPRQDFWRWRGRKPKKNAGVGVVILGDARLPGIFQVGHDDWTDFQIFVPVDADNHLALQVSVKHTSGAGALIWRLRYWSYIRVIHHIMLNRWEDGPIVAMMDTPPERLFRPDISITAWRKFCEDNARRAPAGSAGG